MSRQSEPERIEWLPIIILQTLLTLPSWKPRFENKSAGMWNDFFLSSLKAGIFFFQLPPVSRGLTVLSIPECLINTYRKQYTEAHISNSSSLRQEECHETRLGLCRDFQVSRGYIAKNVTTDEWIGRQQNKTSTTKKEVCPHWRKCFTGGGWGFKSSYHF